MKITPHLDVDVIAVEQDDDVTLMLDLQAPPMPAGAKRLPATIQVVLDRSGSMHGERLDAAKNALLTLIDRLTPEDRLGVVTFDSEVQVVLPLRALTNKLAAKAAVDAIQPGRMTNLSSGLLRGLQELERVGGPQDDTTASGTLLLVSDGHANDGVTDPDILKGVAAKAADHAVTLSTIGIGTGYDEVLLAAIAEGGRGGHAFSLDGDGAAAALAGEVNGLLDRTVQAASLTIRPEGNVESVHVWHDLPMSIDDDALTVELGDLWADELRRIVVTFTVPAKSGLGLAKIATVTVRSVALPALVQQSVTQEVHVNVLPGDQAAGRIPDPVVREQLLLQQTQRAKKEAADRLRAGDAEGARGTLAGAYDAIASAPATTRIAEELRDLGAIRADMDVDALRAAKRAYAEYHQRSRKPGRDRPEPTPPADPERSDPRAP